MAEIIPQAVFNELYPHVGSLTINWGVAESAIEHWVLIIFRTQKGRKREKEIPKAFGRKVQFLRKRLPKIGLSPESLTACLDVVSELKTLSETRNAVTHGALTDYDSTTNKVRFFRLDIETQHNIARLKEHWFTVNEVKDAAHKSLRAARSVHMLTSAIAQKLVP